jgi:uncharacterized protein (TIGR03086 family)
MTSTIDWTTDEDTATDWRPLLTQAHQALRGAVAGVSTDAWNLATPCEQWSMTQVLQHAAGDQVGYAAAITGGPGPTEDPFAPSGHLTEKPLAVLDRALALSVDAWATVEDDAPQVPTPLPQGAMPAWLAAGACALDAAVHAWDIAIASCQQSPLTPEMARPLMAVATRLVEPLRAYGVYAPANQPSADADHVEILLCYLGRRPTGIA